MELLNVTEMFNKNSRECKVDIIGEVKADSPLCSIQEFREFTFHFFLPTVYLNVQREYL